MRYASDVLVVIVTLVIATGIVSIIYNDTFIVAFAQNETTTSEPTISVGNVTVYRFNSTTINIGIYNRTHIILSYLCNYEINTSDCCKLSVYMYDENMSLIGVYNFTNLTKMCVINGICNGVYFIPYGNNTNLTYKIYRVLNNGTTVLLTQGLIVIPGSKISMTGYIALLGELIPIAMLVKLAGRGSVKEVGMGLVVYGIALLIIGYLGIYSSYNYLAFVISLVLGLILVYSSQS